MANKEKDGKKTQSSGGAKSSKSTSSKSAGSAKKENTSAKKKSRTSADSKYDVYDYDEIYAETEDGADVPAKRVKPPVDVSAPKYQVITLLLAAMALFIVLCYAFPSFCGFLGSGIRNVLYGIFSGAAVLVPFLLIIQAIYFKRDLKNRRAGLKVLFSFLVMVFLSVMLHTIFCIFNDDVASLAFSDIKDFYNNGKELLGGGVIGGIFGAIFIKAVGIPGTMIFSILFMILFGIFLFGFTPQHFWKRIAFYFLRFCENRQKLKKERAAKAREERARAAEEEETDEYASYAPNTDTRTNTARYDTRDVRYETYGGTGTTKEVRTSRGDIDEIFQRDLTDPKPKKVKAEKTEKREVRAEERREKEFRGESVEAYIRKSAEEEARARANEPKYDLTLRPKREPRTVPAPSYTPEPKAETNFESEYYKKYDTTDAVCENTLEEEVFETIVPENTGKVAHALGVTEDKIETIPASAPAVSFDGTTEKAEAPEEDYFGGDIAEEPEEDDIPWDIDDEIVGGNEASDITPPPATAAEEKKSDPLADELRRTLDITRRKMQGEPAPTPAPTPAPARASSITPPPMAAIPALEEELEPEVPSYIFPPLELLKSEPTKTENGKAGELQLNAEKLVETLRSFNVRAHVVDVASGPTVTRYEIGLEAGTRVRTIMNLVDDISYALATNGVRIEGVIPGKSAIGIEVPNKTAETVYLRTLLENPKFTEAKSKLTAALGRSVSGDPVYLDIAKMPHLMIAGTTGSGKSVCINTMLISLLYKATPEEVKLVLIDPKKVELNIYNGIPHLLVPVVFDPKKAAGALHWCVTEMERRFDLIESMNVRNIAGYNEAIAGDPTKEKLPQIVIVIDELADLMMTAANEVETSICRIAQKARAAGMHLIIGTQRPSVDVITGLIKANVPSRIAFTVMSQVDSRTIIDAAGAEKLIGRGDMLYAPVGCTKPMRAQGAFVSDAELESVIDFIKEHSTQEENHVENTRAIMERIEKEAALCGKKGKAREEAMDDLGDGEEEEDPKLRSAIQLAVDSGKISTSLIQRKLSLGYGRAAKLIDVMERRGIVAPPEGQKPREVLITKEQYLEMMMNDDTGAGNTASRDDFPEDEI